MKLKKRQKTKSNRLVDGIQLEIFSYPNTVLELIKTKQLLQEININQLNKTPNMKKECILYGY